jgi:hypothetical protein
MIAAVARNDGFSCRAVPENSTLVEQVDCRLDGSRYQCIDQREQQAGARMKTEFIQEGQH